MKQAVTWPDKPIFPDVTEIATDATGTTWQIAQSAVDWLGNRFAVGEKVIYCIGAGRGQMMAIGKVIQIRARVSQTWDRDSREMVPVWDVQVQVITERTSGHWDNSARTKPAWVNPMNITSVQGFAIQTLIAG